MTITVNDMEASLLTLDELREKLAATEALSPAYFSVGDPIRFEAEPSYNHGVTAKAADELVPVYVTLGDNRPLQLTRAALEEMSLTVGLSRDNIATCPAELIIPWLNHWYRGGLAAKRGKHDYQFMVDTEQHQAVAFAKAGLAPFSNLKLLDCAEEMIHHRFGEGAVVVDPKLSHTLRQTTMRLVVVGVGGDVLPDDTWSLGIQLKNSLTGASQTSMEGYLFRWVCTNGQIDTRASSGTYTRRKDSTEDEAYVWARDAVNNVLGGLEHSLDAVRSLTEIGIDGRLSDTLRDVFEHYRIALVHRPKVIRYLEEYDGEITMYVIMNAITQVANDSSLPPAVVESLLRVGGDFPYSADQRCGACHRILHTH